MKVLSLPKIGSILNKTILKEGVYYMTESF